MNTYMDIEFNYHDYGEEKVYLTLGFTLGIATKYFLRNRKDIFVNNLAFANLWANYRKREHGFRFNVDRTLTTVTLEGHTDTLGEDILRLLRRAYDTEYDRKTFDEIKAQTTENFKRAYKSGEFRGWYKSFEIADLNKGFLLQDLIRDLEQITFEKFAECGELLLTPYNSFLYVNGCLRDLTDDEVSWINQILSAETEEAILAAKPVDPYVRGDAHLLELAREAQNIDTVSFSFDDTVSMMDRFLYLMIETEKLPYLDRRVHLDVFDASVITGEQELMKLKNFFKRVSAQKQFEQARGALLTGYESMLERQPEQFGCLAVNLKLNNISLTEYLETLAGVTYEAYREAAQKIRPMVSEAQIVMRRR